MHDLIFPKHISKGLAELLLKVGVHERGRTERITVLGSIFVQVSQSIPTS